eukprot:scaffold876_cov243-Pinguiococcus_pyrenoidosus.AAC.24
MEGVKVAGVIINKVRQEEVETVRAYLEKAIQRFGWGVPVLGCIPYGENLDQPSAMDLETLFETRLIGGAHQKMRRFENYELVTTSLDRFMQKLAKDHEEIVNTCFVTHNSRSDIILGLLSHVGRLDHGPRGGIQPFQGGLILTGSPPGNKPADFVADYIRNANIPILNVGASTSKVLAAIKEYTPKLSSSDGSRTDNVISQYAPHIDAASLIGLAESVKDEAV